MGPFTHTLRQGHKEGPQAPRRMVMRENGIGVQGTAPHEEAFQEVFLEEVTDCTETGRMARGHLRGE